MLPALLILSMNPLNRLRQMRNKPLRVLCSREMPQPLHRLALGIGDLIRCRLAHVGCVAPVVGACQHVDWTVLDACHSVAAVPAT